MSTLAKSVYKIINNIKNGSIKNNLIHESELKKYIYSNSNILTLSEKGKMLIWRSWNNILPTLKLAPKMAGFCMRSCCLVITVMVSSIVINVLSDLKPEHVGTLIVSNANWSLYSNNN